jgi:hypothetical protein
VDLLRRRLGFLNAVLPPGYQLLFYISRLDDVVGLASAATSGVDAVASPAASGFERQAQDALRALLSTMAAAERWHLDLVRRPWEAVAAAAAHVC